MAKTSDHASRLMKSLHQANERYMQEVEGILMRAQDLHHDRLLPEAVVIEIEEIAERVFNATRGAT